MSSLTVLEVGGGVPLTVQHQAGTLAARPAASAVAEGTFYLATDTNTMYRSDGASWVATSTGAAGNTFSGLTDTAFTSLANDDFVLFDSGSSDWENRTPAQVRTALSVGTKSVTFVVHPSDETVATGDGTIGFVIPAEMDAMDLTDVVATAHTAGTTGTMDVQVRRRRNTTNADMLSTVLTIDSGEVSSTSAAASHVIDTLNDDVNEGDTIYIDVDAVQTTPATGLSVTCSFEIP
jgi:hypothetical protein